MHQIRLTGVNYCSLPCHYRVNLEQTMWKVNSVKVKKKSMADIMFLIKFILIWKRLVSPGTLVMGRAWSECVRLPGILAQVSYWSLLTCHEHGRQRPRNGLRARLFRRRKWLRKKLLWLDKSPWKFRETKCSDKFWKVQRSSTSTVYPRITCLFVFFLDFYYVLNFQKFNRPSFVAAQVLRVFLFPFSVLSIVR